MQSAFTKNDTSIFRVRFHTIEEVKKFINLTSKLRSDIIMYSSHYEVDGRSLMGILSLALEYPVDVKVLDEEEREYLSGKMKELGMLVKL